MQGFVRADWCALLSFLFALTSASVAFAQSAVTPPSVVLRTDAAYPEDALRERVQGTVMLVVSLDAAGAITDVSVQTSVDARLDAAAIAAVRTWQFAPARRDNAALPSRIRVPVTFALPAVVTGSGPTQSVETTDESMGSGPVTTGPDPISPAPSDTDDEPVLEARARGRRPPDPRSTSDFVLDETVLRAAPRQSAADLLSSAPGVYISRPEGEAVAHEIYLRGFNAEHGQDMELTLNGAMPINQLSHIHGQGYADLNFIIPEVVRSVRVTEGVYDPRQGDFAVAGSVDFDLGVTARGYRLSASYGSFDTFRAMLLAAPEGADDDTFAAVQVRRTSGFGQSRGALSGSVIGQFAWDLSSRSRFVLHANAGAARANFAGVLRQDDVDAGRVGFYDTYDDASAHSQSALSSRAQLGLRFEHESADGQRTRAGIWLFYGGFRARENFTGYLQRSRTNTAWVGRGDLFEQSNLDVGIGASFEHRTRRYAPVSWFNGDAGMGVSFRTHHITQAQNLIAAPQNETWDRLVDATIQQTDVGAYADTDLRFADIVRVRGGMRMDVLHFDVDDALGNFIPQFRPETYIEGYRRTAIGLAWGPRASVEVKPLSWLRVTAAYGLGYRSPQARTLSEGENAPFARVHSAELGVRFEPNPQYSASVAGYWTALSNDIAFDPTEARLERIGPTTRMGVAIAGQLKPWEFWTTNVSLTAVRATLDEPPPATSSNPSPPFVQGQSLPYVPPVVLRVDSSAEHELAKLGGAPLVGRIGAGFTLLSPRPLPYGAATDTVTLLDARVSVKWRFIELGIEGFNLLARQYAASAFNFVSDWRSTPVPSYVPAQHFSAGQPLTVLGTIGLQL